MKILSLFPVYFLAVLSSIAQKKEFNIDYVATYAIAKSQDTISLGIGDEGRFIYSDSPILAKSMGRSFEKMLPNSENVSISFLMDLEEENITMCIINDGMKVYGAIDFSVLFPQGESDEEANKLLSFQTDRTIVVNEEEYRIHSLGLDSEPIEKIEVAFDSQYPLDYNKHFAQFFSGIFKKEFSIKIPNGILVYAEEKEKELLRLISMDPIDKKGKISFEMSLTEKKE